MKVTQEDNDFQPVTLVLETRTEFNTLMLALRHFSTDYVLDGRRGTPAREMESKIRLIVK